MSKSAHEMSIWDHLEELRKRLLVAILALVVAAGVSFYFAPGLLDILASPVGGLENLHVIRVTENLSVTMKVSLLGGTILAMPVLVFELLAFILPGLHQNEKRWIYFGAPSASFLFLGGVLFAYYVMLPVAIPFLTSFLETQTSIILSDYIDFVTNLLFYIGLSFEIPLIIFILAKLKLVTARVLLKQWRVAILVIAIIAAIATPTTDPVNMAILMVPLFLLYWLSVLLAALA
ncbi:MAG: twin-arginine translocase subunit TatC [Anaerolineaceae bacterium]|nr:twin-arginine translocase subunit TatC [Anaerolineaceae bacterium]MBN2677944.1 twin-arginine translocase subunit TatC [Anaerolineaceae bacterium]